MWTLSWSARRLRSLRPSHDSYTSSYTQERPAPNRYRNGATLASPKRGRLSECPMRRGLRHGATTRFYHELAGPRCYNGVVVVLDATRFVLDSFVSLQPSLVVTRVLRQGIPQEVIRQRRHERTLLRVGGTTVPTLDVLVVERRRSYLHELAGVTWVNSVVAGARRHEDRWVFGVRVNV